MTYTDPAIAAAAVRHALAREGARMPRTDHNGRPMPPPSIVTAPAAPTGPAAIRRPAPNPAQGFTSEDAVGDMIRDARSAGRWTQAELMRREYGR